jgi:hypothetical protein
VSSDDEDEDGSDWLSSQFDATAQVPARPVAATPPPPTPAAPTPAVQTPVVAATPAVAPTPTVPFTPSSADSPAQAEPVAPEPVASAPEPNANGGFNWGLKPGGSVVEPPPTPDAMQPPAAATPPAVIPPAVIPASTVNSPPAAVTPPPLIAPPASTPYVGPPTEPYVAEPTKPLSWDEFASTQQQSAPVAPPSAVSEATEAYTVQPWQPAAVSSSAQPEHPEDTREPTSAIDSLFGDHKFQDYEEVGVLQTIQVPPATQVAEPMVVVPREPLSSTQKALMGVAAGLIAALILVGLFFLGQHLGTAAAAVPVPKATGSAASATPTPAGTGGPVAPGVRQWSALQGGECIQPFTSAWADSFTVVACTADHDAEMVFKGTLPAGSDAQYPSASAFQKEITPLCSAPTAINYAAAVSVTDLQVSFSYPPNTATWLKGDRTYYCFVDRVSGGNLPGDLSVPKTK